MIATSVNFSGVTYQLHVHHLDSRSNHPQRNGDVLMNVFPAQSQIFQWLVHPVGGSQQTRIPDPRMGHDTR